MAGRRPEDEASVESDGAGRQGRRTNVQADVLVGLVGVWIVVDQTARVVEGEPEIEDFRLDAQVRRFEVNPRGAEYQTGCDVAIQLECVVLAGTLECRVVDAQGLAPDVPQRVSGRRPPEQRQDQRRLGTGLGFYGCGTAQQQNCTAGEQQSAHQSPKS